MKRAQKKQVESILDVLEAAHEEIKKEIENKNDQKAMELLEQCQSRAIQLGTLIEEAEGEGVSTVHMLEEYCELTYQIHETIASGKLSGFNKIYKKLRKVLIEIKNSVRNELIVRKEAVFLPYKVSMWDSMESVWKAAHEDPEYDVYVIPIPYYDERIEGSLGTMHYEGDLYPEYVPITNYNEFDFEEHLPDMIFIHYPYDNINKVTGIPPLFYSVNLKKYTENLIYIPYFLLNEISPENKVEVGKIEHLITVPAVLHADRVIVQSENMRNIYINRMTALLKGKNVQMDWQEKIIGLGSPKLEKVLSTRKEDIEIPKEWLRIIKKPDGSFKKIILYNTCLTAMLRSDGKMIEKIKDTIQVFSDHQNEIALLWRPHPLVEATIKSMRPHLWAEYHRMVEAYKKEGWGIFDESVDINRAVAVCDAYYGDASSVVDLCKSAGKKIMIQSVSIVKENKENEAAC